MATRTKIGSTLWGLVGSGPQVAGVHSLREQPTLVRDIGILSRFLYRLELGERYHTCCVENAEDIPSVFCILNLHSGLWLRAKEVQAAEIPHYVFIAIARLGDHSPVLASRLARLFLARVALT